MGASPVAATARRGRTANAHRPEVGEVGVRLGQDTGLPEQLRTSAAGLADERRVRRHRHPGIRRDVAHLRRSSRRGEHDREVQMEVPHGGRQRAVRAQRGQYTHVLRGQQVEDALLEPCAVQSARRARPRQPRVGHRHALTLPPTRTPRGPWVASTHQEGCADSPPRSTTRTA